MCEEKIRVIAYSGYRDEELPREMIIDGNRIEILKILSRWVEQTPEDRSIKRFFAVEGSDGFTYEIYHHENKMEWFVRLKGC